MSFVLANLVIFASSVANVCQINELNNKTTETQSEMSEHHKYRQASEKPWPWLYLNANKMFCKVCMKEKYNDNWLHNFQNRKMHVKNGPLGL
jgi:hypothetical protein